MRTYIDINETHKLVLAVDLPGFHAAKYELLDGQLIDPNYRFSPYLKQAHYVAGHAVQGLLVVSRHMPTDGWLYWSRGK